MVKKKSQLQTRQDSAKIDHPCQLDLAPSFSLVYIQLYLMC